MGHRGCGQIAASASNERFGITAATATAAAAAVAATGVDLISAGWITHSARALDVSLDVVPQA